MAALRTAGGMLLLLMGIDLVFSRTTGASNATEEDVLEAEHKSDIAVFPLATPLIAGPGTMGCGYLADGQCERCFFASGNCGFNVISCAGDNSFTVIGREHCKLNYWVMPVCILLSGCSVFC
jgi:hypothetical protein